MISLKDIQNIYLIGIGGMGMSALARYFHERGCVVSGSDRAASILTKTLDHSGIKIHYSDDVGLLDKAADLVIYTPAIAPENKEFSFYKEQQYPMYKRSEVLQWILLDMKCIAISGTHGKTTISAMTAHILRDSGYGCNAFLGGMTSNYDTNYWSSERQVAVVEADEYDRSFLRLSPDVAVLSAMDADHLDIYKTEKNLQDAFIQFTNQIKPDGLLIFKNGLKRCDELGGSKKCSYAIKNENAGLYVRDLKINNGGYIFNIVQDHKLLIKDVQLPIGGRHNVENALAATAVAFDFEIDKDAIRKALASFKGVKRRFEYIIRSEKQIYIDDYAHHPEELKNLLLSTKELFPDKKCTLLFQPHLYSRTRDMAKEFATALDLADEVWLLPIYPAREEPVEGVCSRIIAKEMNPDKVHLTTKDGMLEKLKVKDVPLFITAGAGDIGVLVNEIKNNIEEKTISNTLNAR